MERAALNLSEFTVNLRKHVDPASPVPLRMMAAKGLVPMAPQEMVLVLYQLSCDRDSGVQNTAGKTLSGTPADILATALGSEPPAAVLDWAADVFRLNDPALELIVTNANTTDDTLSRVASRSTAGISDLIAENQVRLLRHPKIIEALYMNAEARMSTVDKVVDLARRNGVALDGLPALRPLMDSEVPIVEEPAADDPTLTAADTIAADQIFGQFLSEALLDEDLADEREETEPETTEEDDPRRRSRGHFLANCRVAAKIRFAMLGSREDRSILVRDTNRLVHLAAVGSPKVSDGEAIGWSSNRALPESVITYIAQKRDWIRNYQVKLNLANNPKLPLRAALRLMPHLHPRDLNNLARNRNVPNQLQKQAKELSAKRRSGRQQRR